MAPRRGRSDVPGMGHAAMADRIQPLQLGFIGCGVVTERGHLPALRSLPAAEVVAVADID